MKRHPTYSFWKLWHDEKRQLWAEPYHAIDSTAARRAHSEACRFGWGLAGQYDRHVSELHASDGTHSVTLAPSVSQAEVGRQERWDER